MASCCVTDSFVVLVWFFIISTFHIIDSDPVSECDCLISCSNFGDFYKLIISFIAIVVLDGDLIIKADDVSTGRNKPSVFFSALAIEVDGLMMNGNKIFLLLRDIAVDEVKVHACCLT